MWATAARRRTFPLIASVCACKCVHLEIAPVSGAEWEQLIADIYRTPADVVEETKAVLR